MSLTSIRKQVYSTLHTQRHRSAIDTEFYCKASATTAMRDGQKVKHSFTPHHPWWHVCRWPGNDAARPAWSDL